MPMDDTEEKADIHTGACTWIQPRPVRNRRSYRDATMDHIDRQFTVLGLIRVRCVAWVIACCSASRLNVPVLGSWEGEIRLWKLDSKLKSFALMGTLPAAGVVNSLQLISVPKDAFPGTSWVFAKHDSEARAKRAAPAAALLLVAGVGQEHRLGRWMRLKGDGVVNGTLVVALHPRTLD